MRRHVVALRIAILHERSSTPRMLFNSYLFIFVYLPIVFMVFFLIGYRNRILAAGWLACASFIFYAWWSPTYSLLLLASIGFNYLCGSAISIRSATKRGQRILVFAIAVNLTVLCYFKYAIFLLSSIEAVSSGFHPALNITLPLGISFFTFTQIAFLVDAYRGLAKEYSPVHYLLFVTYFPHLIAGPIIHHKQMMPQFHEKRTYRLDWMHVAMGLSYFAIGLAKKELLADNLAPYADRIFHAVDRGFHPDFVYAWTSVLAYAFQLYFDFSGYCDMAIGISWLFGIALPVNFNSPYKAVNIVDFWRRWHITLSSFLRDYLYFPLGGNRKGKALRYRNLMLTMLLGGLWHGASWTFVLWGGLHGVANIVASGSLADSAALDPPRKQAAE